MVKIECGNFGDKLRYCNHQSERLETMFAKSI